MFYISARRQELFCCSKSYKQAVAQANQNEKQPVPQSKDQRNKHHHSQSTLILSPVKKPGSALLCQWYMKNLLPDAVRL